ncbi:DHHC zinc finger protein (macronuclear) [Tetrahymena thermophila SB210]|uniref:Palmitoyltransferase n=1 Tax=Tetrahymena thermophila (strain SB210) TaxID=312017 RepID=Q22DZ8_TETTS|nr:DHHC zinc finger protein [Tetrahymena thermophila SB210]EAR83514.2 DHHC zinc finger protein [Tetrahymena thermophila SB210]|eukprot:XP_001031177.2 DHHC zinc finger protein [Tetrahymena thermophila SB210]
MNQTSILQHNDILLRVEEQTYKLNRNDNQQQYCGSNGQINNYSNQQSFINGISRQNHFINPHRQSNISSNGINLKDNNTVSYKVNIYQANNAQESRTQINAQYSTIHQNGSTQPNHQQSQKEDIQQKNLLKTLFSCHISWRLALFCVIQLMEKFFFFTLFLYSITAEVFQIIIGLIYGITSAAKYFLTIYTFNADLSENSNLNKDCSEDESVESNKMKFCNKCQEKVNLDCFHCEICDVCIYKKFFHSKLIGKCISQNNKRLIQIIIGMNIIEGLIFVAIGVVSISKCIQDIDSFKNEVIQIYKNASKEVLMIIILILLVIISIAVFINSLIFKILYQAINFQVERPAPKQPINEIPQRIQENPKSLNNIPGQPGSIQHITGGSTIFKNQQSLNKTPTLVHSISGLGRPDRRKFESHWKISPPDGKQEVQQLVSMNSYGTIYNFISKKVASCENIEKIPTNSPSKSIKSLNSIDQSIFKKTRQKSQNLSKIEIKNELKKKQTQENTLIV